MDVQPVKFRKGLVLGIIALSATLSGCLLGNSAGTGEGDARLVIGVQVKDVDNLSKPGLGKSSTVGSNIVLNKLIITLTSSVGTDSVIRDTVLADTGAFSSNSASNQQILRNYGVKALRSWTVQVKTLDVKDSVIHLSSSTTGTLTVGQVVPVQLNLASRFVVYVAKFVLPDSIGSSDVGVTAKQKLFIDRFVMVVDGDTVRDSTASAYFGASPAEHLLVWNYVRADTVHNLRLYVYADSLRMADSSGIAAGGWKWPKNLPLFGDTIQITSTDSTYTPELPWTGPGSPNDPACQVSPTNCGGARAGLEINLGAVGLVNITPTVPINPLPKRKD